MNSLHRLGTAGTLAEEHRTLRAMALETARVLDGEECSCESPEICRCTYELLRSFVALMDELLESEQASWATPAPDRTDWTARFMDWAPRSQSERLQREHEHLRVRLDDVRALLETTASPETKLPRALILRLRSLLDETLRLELTEAQLFQQSLFEGLGEAVGCHAIPSAS